jgi:hypothetical protein
MKRPASVDPAAPLMLALVVLSLPLAAQSSSDPAAPGRASDTARPSSEATKEPLNLVSLAQESQLQPPAATQSSPTQATPEKSDDAEKNKPPPGESAKDVLQESTQGNGGRVLGVLPNYRTTNTGEVYKPLRSKDKWLIAYHDSFDYTVFLVAGAFAGLHQLDNAHPQFGQGMEGYAKYYGTAYLDQTVGNIMTEGLFPSMLHEDPRYFRKGSGSISSRVGSAVKQIFVVRTDSGGYRFNTSEWGGNAVATAFQNVYYSDSRNAKDNTVNLFVACGTDTASNILKEFWPDIKHKLFKK